MVNDVIDELCEILKIKCFTVKEKTVQFNDFADEELGSPEELGDFEDLDEDSLPEVEQVA